MSIKKIIWIFNDIDIILSDILFKPYKLLLIFELTRGPFFEYPYMRVQRDVNGYKLGLIVVR